MSINRKKIALIVTVESAVLCFMLAQLRELQKFYDVTLFINTDNPEFLIPYGIHIQVIPLKIERDIYPWRDTLVLIALIKQFRRRRFDLVQSLMPKAGLLAMLAGFMAGVPVRSHIFTGQVWATRTGMSRILLKMIDRLMVFASTHLLSDSPSQRDFLVDQKIVRSGCIRVLDKGSMCGVDIARFHSDQVARQDIRLHYGIKQDDIVFLFVGRLNRDKGVLDLARAFKNLCDEVHNIHLLIVGPEEEKGIVQEIKSISEGVKLNVHFVGFVTNPEHYMAASDVFCLPSYRESFGDVIMEAAAVGIPSIGSNIYGIIDTIDDGKNGLLYEVGKISALSACMKRLANNKKLRQNIGASAHQRAVEDFSSIRVAQVWMRYYEALLCSHEVKPKLCLVIATEMTVTAFMLGYIQELSKKYDVTVAVNTKNINFLAAYGCDAHVVPLDIKRAITFWHDVKILMVLIHLFRCIDFKIVQSVTPKAGLLSMLAAFITRVPFRIHIFTGQVWATQAGALRWFLKSLDKLLSFCATHLLADSISQRKFLDVQGVVRMDKVSVLAHGSICGVDIRRFKPDEKKRILVRNELGLSGKDFIFLYVGRLNREKGLLDLVAAFDRINSEFPHAYLLFVGPDEGNISESVHTECDGCRMHFVNYSSAPENYMAASDVFCLPSYREGFGSVIIEAAACGVPAIGSNIYGVTDAIVDGKTGLLYDVADIDALADCMRQLLNDKKLRKHMGDCARERTVLNFSNDQVIQAWMKYYEALS